VKREGVANIVHSRAHHPPSQPTIYTYIAAQLLDKPATGDPFTILIMDQLIRKLSFFLEHPVVESDNFRKVLSLSSDAPTWTPSHPKSVAGFLLLKTNCSSHVVVVVPTDFLGKYTGQIKFERSGQVQH
jgi:hypothetical protein